MGVGGSPPPTTLTPFDTVLVTELLSTCFRCTDIHTRGDNLMKTKGIIVEGR